MFKYLTGVSIFGLLLAGCGETPHTHTAGGAVKENEVAPTCTVDGSYDLVTYCTGCGEELSRTHEVSTKLNHDLVHHNAKAPSCGESGWDAYDTCKRCDYTTYHEIAPTGEHTITYHDEDGEPATCTEAGYHYHVGHCSVCDQEISREVVADEKLGHDMQPYNGKPATCTEAGYTAYQKCSRCGLEQGKEVINPTNHPNHATREENLVPANCTEAGSYDLVTYCVDCQEELSRESKTIPALGHKLVHHAGQAATCTVNGWEEYDTCERCDYTTYTAIEAPGHQPVFNNTTLEYTCSECLEVVARDYEMTIELEELHVGDLYEKRGPSYTFKNDDHALDFGFVTYEIKNNVISPYSGEDYHFEESYEGYAITAHVYVVVLNEKYVVYGAESKINCTVVYDGTSYENHSWMTAPWYDGKSRTGYHYAIPLGTLLPAAPKPGAKPVFSEDGTTVTYGLYPKTRVPYGDVKIELNKVTNPSTYSWHNWYELNGEYYAYNSYSEQHYSNVYFDDGTKVVSGASDWFKCEPITWKVIKQDNNEYTLLSEQVLQVTYWSAATSMYIPEGEIQAVSPSNYERSNIRSTLEGMYNAGFSKSLGIDNSYIQTTTVDNSPSTTMSNDNPYCCNPTEDKIFLLSYQDYLNSDYGFDAENVASETRAATATDYAKSRGVGVFEGKACYLTRSPYYEAGGYYQYRYVSNVNYNGRMLKADVRNDYNYTTVCGIRAAMVIRVS